jgi:RecA/RadA recombinase
LSKFKSIEDLFSKAGIESDSDNASPVNFLDTGIPQLNSIISGDPKKGLPSGRIAEISGESASGKTMLATRLMISAQQQQGFAMFFDHERAYEKHLSVKQGMRDDKNSWLYREAKIFEQSLDQCLAYAKLLRENEAIPPTAPIVAIFDSFAAMVPMITASKNATERTMNDTTALSRAASRELPSFNTDVNDLGICAVFLNQLADTMAMHGPKKKTKGGNSLPFYASTRLHIKGEAVKKNGILQKKIMHISTVKNRLRKPGEIVGVDFVFNNDGSGDFDILGGYARFLKTLGAIEGSGAWLMFEGQRYNGIDKLVEELYLKPSDSVLRLKNAHTDFLARVEVAPAVADPDFDGEEETE